LRGQVIKEFTVKKPHIETATALGRVLPVHALSAYPAYIGLDVHKETIAVAVARKGREAPEFRVETTNRAKAVTKRGARLCKEFHGEVLLFCYEAGPCGYVPYRQLLELDQDCR